MIPKCQATNHMQRGGHKKKNVILVANQFMRGQSLCVSICYYVNRVMKMLKWETHIQIKIRHLKQPIWATLRCGVGWLHWIRIKNHGDEGGEKKKKIGAATSMNNEKTRMIWYFRSCYISRLVGSWQHQHTCQTWPTCNMQMTILLRQPVIICGLHTAAPAPVYYIHMLIYKNTIPNTFAEIAMLSHLCARTFYCGSA